MARTKITVRDKKRKARSANPLLSRWIRSRRIRQYAFAVLVFGGLFVVSALTVAKHAEEARFSKLLPTDPVAVGQPDTESDEVFQVSEPKKKIQISEEDAEAWNYFHPVWQDEPIVAPSLESVSLKLHDAQHGVQLERWVDDPKNRITDDFDVPRAMRERVLFWMRVHSRFSNDMRVHHDRKNLSIVYGYSDFTSIYRTSETKMKAFYAASQIERRILRQLRARILEAANLSQTHLLTPWEKAELRALISRAGALTPKGVYDLLENIRSQTGQRDEFLAALTRSEKLLPFIESVFARMGLPVALARVPFVESSFNPRAQSKVGAMGVWQFMPETARQMIGPNPEHWSDPLNQTWAAARLFRILRTMLPDWSTAITSYNSGAGRLKRLSQRYRTDSVVKLLDVHGGDTLGFAGKNFYAQFLSANIIEAYKYEIFKELNAEHQDMLAFTEFESFGKKFR